MKPKGRAGREHDRGSRDKSCGDCEDIANHLGPARHAERNAGVGSAKRGVDKELRAAWVGSRESRSDRDRVRKNRGSSRRLAQKNAVETA